MPDVNVICTAGAERDLRFYDTTAQKFELRILITSLPEAVSTMNYSFYENVNKRSRIIIGDMKGIVRLIEFNSKDRGPFKSQLGFFLTTMRWETLVKVMFRRSEVVNR